MTKLIKQYTLYQNQKKEKTVVAHNLALRKVRRKLKKINYFFCK